MADWTTTIQGLAPLAFGAVGALTAQPNTQSSTKQNTFLTPGSEGLFNQGVGLVGQAGPDCARAPAAPRGKVGRAASPAVSKRRVSIVASLVALGRP